jgi:hypothetical protein
MGFFQGVLEEINRQEDIGTRREEFMMNLFEKRKSLILPELIEIQKNRRAKVSERSDRVNKAVKTHNFSKEAAAILESAGKLEGLMPMLDKIAESPDSDKSFMSSERMKTLTEVLVGAVGPDRLAQAIEYAVDTGYLEDGSSDTLLEAIYANTEEEFQDAIEGALKSGESGTQAPKIGNFTINKRAFVGLSAEQEKEARRQIEDQLSGPLNAQWNQDRQRYTYENNPAAATIVANATYKLQEALVDPFEIRDPSTVARDITNHIAKLINQTNDLQDVADNEDFVLKEGPPYVQPVTVQDVTQSPNRLTLEQKIGG